MGKDNIVFHSVIWPGMLLGHNGEGDHGGTDRPDGGAAAARRDRVERVPDDERVEVLHQPRQGHLRRATSSRDSGRTRCATSSPSPGRRRPTPTSPGTSSSAGPTSSWPTSGATWSTARSRWRTRTTARSRRRPTCATSTTQLLAHGSAPSFDTVGAAAAASSRFKQAITEAMRLAGAANKYLSDSEPWKLSGRPGPARHGPAHRAAGRLGHQHAAHAVPAARGAEGARGARRQRRLGGAAGDPDRRARRAARTTRC